MHIPHFVKVFLEFALLTSIAVRFSDCDQVDNDCFEPAGYSSLPVGGADGTTGGSGGSSSQATVGGLKLHLPLDEDDYLMPSNGQQAGYMDLGGHQKGTAPTQPSLAISG